MAIAQAQERAVPYATFVESALNDIDPGAYADFDFVLALGLLPYLVDDEVVSLTRILSGKPFLFDYHPAGPSLNNALHWLYRKAAGHAFYRMHRPPEIDRLLRENAIDEFDLVRDDGLSFAIHLWASGSGRD